MHMNYNGRCDIIRFKQISENAWITDEVSIASQYSFTPTLKFKRGSEKKSVMKSAPIGELPTCFLLNLFIIALSAYRLLRNAKSPIIAFASNADIDNIFLRWLKYWSHISQHS